MRPCDLQLLLPPAQLFEDGLDCGLPALRLHHVVALGIDRQPRILLPHGAEQRIDLRQRIDLVAEELDAVGVLIVGGKHLDHVAAHAKRPAAEIGVVALVENLHQTPRDVVAAHPLPLLEQQQHAVIRLRRAEAVDARDRRHDDGIAPLEQRARGRKPELVQLLVDRGFFLDVEVARRNVGFRLVIVVVRDEIFDRIVREELFELVKQAARPAFCCEPEPAPGDSAARSSSPS